MVDLVETAEPAPPARGLAPGDPGLLATSLARPSLPPGFVPRPHVATRLDAGTRGALTLVSAGAGWGKTLATAAWAAAGPAVGPVAWVSLDAGDNEPRAFWSYAAEALRQAGAVPQDNPLAGMVPGPGPEAENLSRLVAGLARLPHPVVLVLDDFQAIDDPRVLAGLATALRLPEPRLRLVLLTRADPLLPLHRLRIAGELTEIRSRDLALDVADAARLITHDGAVLGPGDAELLVDRTEGWPAGLRLAALFLTRDEPGHSASDFGGEDRAVVEYLAEEVLARHPPDVQRFLMRTSVVDQVSASLAEVLTGQARGQQHLEALAASNTFVVGLGPGSVWFRYHALLRQTLGHRLSVEAPDEVPELHRRAAGWFAEHGQPLEALRHAADAQDWGLMGRLLARQCLPLALSVDRFALGVVLARIPEHHLADTPELALAAATRLMLADRWHEIGAHLDRAEQQQPSSDPEVATGTRIGALLFRVALARTRGDDAAIVETSSRALEEVSGPGAGLPAAGSYRATALANLGTGLLWSGRITSAERHLRDGLAQTDGTALDAVRVNMLSHLALAAACTGRLRSADRLADSAITIVRERGWAPLVQAATAHLARSVVHFQRDEVDLALGALAEARLVAVHDRAPRCAVELFQVRVDAALGRVDAARGRLERLERELGGWQPPRLLARWRRTVTAEVQLAAGDPASALAQVPLDRADDHGCLLVPERIVRARALLASGDPGRADATLAPLRDPALEPRWDAQVWALSALAADQLREDRRATQSLRQALRLAEPEGVRRPFTGGDLEHLARLLTRVWVLDPGSRGFIDRLGVAGGRPTDGSGAPDLALTDREMSVLQYLPSLMTYPEIAAELFVSVNTIKSHLRHAYAKLEVSSRRQAVARARDLGILDP